MFTTDVSKVSKDRLHDQATYPSTFLTHICTFVGKEWCESPEGRIGIRDTHNSSLTKINTRIKYFVRRDRRGNSHHEQSVVLPVFVQEQRGPVLLVLERVADVLGVLQSDSKRSR